VAQHFLLSAKARTLSLKAIMGMSDDEAHARFVAIRFGTPAGSHQTTLSSCLPSLTYQSDRWRAGPDRTIPERCSLLHQCAVFSTSLCRCEDRATPFGSVDMPFALVFVAARGF
jgi:hypothetical protein